MKAILEFNLPEDQMEFACCNKASDMAIVLFEIQYNLPKKVFAELEHKTYTDQEAVELVFERIHNLLDEQNIIIDTIIQ